MTSGVLPAVFIGHGSPMNALDDNDWTRAWVAFGADLPPVRGILAISAHWYIGATAVTAMSMPPTIHDFQGFPPELHRFDSPAPGDPALARRVADLLSPLDVVADENNWGLDHGTWSVLAHLRPAADVPVVQLSLNRTLGVADHVALGRRLAPLRNEGILVMCSGNVVHNLAAMDWARPNVAFDWAEGFEHAVGHTLTDVDRVATGFASLLNHPGAQLAVPTPEHFMPLAYLAGLASVAGQPLRRLTDGIAYGSVSMSSWVLDPPT